MSARRVIVIGGGLAGLTAALDCVEAGLDVVLLEGRDRLGGATWSRPHRGLGFEIDNGQHVFMRCCEAYRAFLDRVGRTDAVVLQDRLAVPVARPGRRLAWIRRRGLPAPAHLAPSLLGFAPLPPAARWRVARAMLALGGLDPAAPALDDVSLGDWLAARGTPLGADAPFWDLLIRATLNVRAPEASLALAAKVLRTGFLDRADGADLGWSRVPLRRLHAEPAAALLRRRGAVVDTRAPVEAVTARAGGGVRVASRGHVLEADAAIVATPHEAAAALLDGAPGFDAKAVRALGRSPIVNLHCVYDRPVLAQPFVAAMHSELQWIFDRTATSGLARGQYLTVSLSAGDAYLGQGTAALRARFEPALRALLPRARAARLLRFAVTVEREATFRPLAGTRRGRPSPGRVAPGLYVAGAYTDTGWPATMEGAVRSGHAAAAALRRDVLGADAPGDREAA